MRKILYSPGYGAGWSSWMNVPAYFACTYQPIIDALENNELLLPGNVDEDYAQITDYHPSVQSFIKECQEKYNKTPYLGGIKNLSIHYCDDNTLVSIKCFDGSESVKENMNREGFF